MKLPPLPFILFSFSGRIGRGVWALFTVIYLIAEIVMNAGLRAMLDIPAPVLTGSDPFFLGFVRDLIDAVLILFLPLQLALDVKRWHDIGVSGWNVLWLYAPFTLLLALGEAGAGGTGERPESYAVVLVIAFIVIVVAYLFTLASRPGQADANAFGAPERTS